MTYEPRNVYVTPENVITSKDEMKYTCGYCGVKQARILHCSGCNKIAYCSVDCQARGRPRHEAFCQKNNMQLDAILGAPCRFCKKTIENPYLIYACPGCSDAVYCCRTCLGKDWPKHKLQCLNRMEGNDEGNIDDDSCSVCASKENVKTCSRCNCAKYCSKACQKSDWKNHKEICTKTMIRTKIEIEEKWREMRRLEIRWLNLVQRSGQPYFKRKKDEDFSIHLFDDNADITIYKRPDAISWEKALSIASTEHPDYEIISRFNKLPSDVTSGANKKPSLMVAFIPRYHHYRGRYCVYVEDKKESEMYITFYFKPHDQPDFKWSQMQPGKFIMILNAFTHKFEDFTTGFRIYRPDEIQFFEEVLYTNSE